MGTPLPESYRKASGERYLSGTEWEYEDALHAAAILSQDLELRLSLSKPGYLDTAVEIKLTEPVKQSTSMP